MSNIELLDQQAGGDISVASNSMMFESSLRDDTIWAARNEYRLRYVDGELRMALQEGDPGQQRESAVHALVPHLKKSQENACHDRI